MAHSLLYMASMDALSESAEMMIKNINELASNGERVRTSDLSDKTELKPASVTEMIQRLGEIGLVDYEPYHGVHLTKQGQHVMILKKKKPNKKKKN